MEEFRDLKAKGRRVAGLDQLGRIETLGGI